MFDRPSPSPSVARRLLLQTLAVTPLLSPMASSAAPLSLSFRDRRYLHRWSRDGQHEFTPDGDADLQRWQDMLTLNLHPAVDSGEALAGLANGVLGNYQRHGRILQTRSLPRTPERPAEHLIVAVLAQPQRLEAAFARCRLHEGQGLVAVASHRVHGTAAGPAMSEWLRREGAATEQALMAWAALPTPAQLQRLPQTR